MWIEELRIENIRSFDTETVLLFRKAGTLDKPHKWVTFL